MDYAIVGSGAIGGALVKQFASHAVPVLVTNRRGPNSLMEMASKYGGLVTPVSIQRALMAEVVILAVPYDEVSTVVADVQDWKGRIVIDATNALEFPSFKPKDLGGLASTAIISGKIPSARVVKAFNTLPAALLAEDPLVNGANRVIFISGDDAHANSVVASLVVQLGFAPLELGKISEGGRLQEFGGKLMVHNLIKLH